MPLIACVGAASCTPQEAEIAHSLGRLLAQEGFGVICGGRGGVMEAVSQGAHEAGGVVLGLLPGDDAKQGNPFLTFALPTGMGEARNALIVRAAQAVVAIGGGYGTLSEIALALKMGKPVIGIGAWQASSAAGKPLEIERVDSAAQAVEALKPHLRQEC